jgi:hypothetical protein
LGAPAVAVGLGVLELALVRLAGPPGRQLEVLRQLDQVGADPLASVLALLALGAEGLAAYLLAVLGLRLLATVPGAIGRLAAGATALATPATVRRALDLLLGGAGWRRRPSRPSPPERPPLPRRRPLLPRLRPPPRHRCPPGRAVRQPVRRGRGRGALAAVAGDRQARPRPDPSRDPPARASLPTRPPMREPTVGFGGVGPAASGAVVPEG